MFCGWMRIWPILAPAASRSASDGIQPTAGTSTAGTSVPAGSCAQAGAAAMKRKQSKRAVLTRIREPYTARYRMRLIETALPEVLVLEPQVFEDARGFAFESYNKRRFGELTGIDVEFVQDNRSRSAKNV